MKLNCPTCHADIPNSRLNLSAEIAHCISCDEFYNVSSQISAQSSQLERPTSTAIQITSELNGSAIHIPSAGWNRRTTIALLLIICITIIISIFLSVYANLADSDFTSLIIFSVISITIILRALHSFLFSLFGTIQLKMNRDQIALTQKIFGISYTLKRKTALLTEISEDVQQRGRGNAENAYNFNVALKFSRQRTLLFGSQLTSEERKWLIAELRIMKRKYQNPGSI